MNQIKLNLILLFFLASNVLSQDTNLSEITSHYTENPEWIFFKIEDFNLTGGKILGTDIVSTAADNEGNIWFSADAEGLVKIDGSIWKVHKTPGTENIVFDSIGNVWITTVWYGIWKFDGVNWWDYNSYNTGYNLETIHAIFPDKENNIWLGTRDSGIVVFDGKSIKKKSELNAQLTSPYINSIKIDNAGNIWIAMSPYGGIHTTGGGILKFSRNNFTLFNEDVGLPHDMGSLLLDKYDNLWASTSDGIFKYDGSTWTRYTIKEGLPNALVKPQTFDTEGNLWAISYMGPIKFDGKNWELYNSLEISERAYSVAVDKYGNKWIGMKGGIAVFNEYGLTDVDKSEKNTNEKKQYYLKQNYPNPFNPTTIIEYFIPEQTNVTLKIFDLLGREIMTLMNEEKAPGNYQVEFDGSSVPSGVYFYRLEAGQFIETKEFIFMK